MCGIFDNGIDTSAVYFQISFCRNSLDEQERVVDSIQEEIHMMSRLNHPNIVRILGATQQGCHFFMFVEWMPGKKDCLIINCSFILRTETLISNVAVNVNPPGPSLG